MAVISSLPMQDSSSAINGGGSAAGPSAAAKETGDVRRFDSSVAAEFAAAVVASGSSGRAVAMSLLDDEGEVKLEFSYAELDRWADHIALTLAKAVPSLLDTEAHRRSGPLGGELPFPTAASNAAVVALAMPRKPVVIAAMLGVWRLRAAIATLPHDAPPPRLATLASDAWAVLVEEGSPLSGGETTFAAPVVALSPQLPSRSLALSATAGEAKVDLGLPSPDGACMIVYTSGSTGKPKGVLCSHRSLWHSVSCYGESVDFSPASRMIWKTPYQWRTAEWEMFPPLCRGGRVFVAPEGANRRIEYLVDMVTKHKLDVLTMVPTVLAPIADLLAIDSTGTAGPLRHVTAVGEPLPSRLCGLFLGKNGATRGGGGGSGTLMQNYYGLSETAMTQWRCLRVPEGTLAPAGHAQPCASVHLVPAAAREGGDDGAGAGDAEAGAGEGEIYFGGVMSSGYLGDEALTAQRFVRFPAAERGIAFRSGDLGRWNSHGELEVLGRIDRQIKLHGVRIELGDIEASMLERCREVAVVQAEEDKQTLVGFYSGGAGWSPEEMRKHVSANLPSYMVPLHFVALDALPRLPSEKVDHVSLRARTKGMATRAQALKLLKEGGASSPSSGSGWLWSSAASAPSPADSAGADGLVRYVDSLGFARALDAQRAADRRLSDNLMVLGMLNVVLYHWYWCVLVNPRTYLPPWKGHAFGDTVAMPHIPVATWAMALYRIMTQEWINGVFVFAAVHSQSDEELWRFTRRDLAIFCLYLYMGALPMSLSLVLPEPWGNYMFHAETIHRWFLLSLLAGKAVLVFSRRLAASAGASPGVIVAAASAVLVAALVAVPPCLGNLCGAGGEYLLPTDWWPRCQACLVSPKEIVCALLFVLLASLRRPLDRLRRRGAPLDRPAAGLFVFAISSLLAVVLPGQGQIEFGVGAASWRGHFLRLSGLLLTVLQTAGLVAACGRLSQRVHLSWTARWTLGSYIFNVNILDAFFLPPQKRWNIVEHVQVGGPLVSGLLTWIVMLTPAVIFMTLLAPLLQLGLVVGPAQLLVKLSSVSRICCGRLANACLRRDRSSIPVKGYESNLSRPLLK